MCSFQFEKHTVKGGVHKKYVLPCGKCPICVKAKYKAWLFRLTEHLKVVSNPRFVTLTYADQHLKYQENVDEDTGEVSYSKTLSKRDIQLFLKKLRKEYAKYSNKKISYFFVGEYGSKKGRPHYHALLFNLDKPELIHQCWGMGHTYSPALDPKKGVLDTYLSTFPKEAFLNFVIEQKSSPLYQKELERIILLSRL